MKVWLEDNIPTDLIEGMESTKGSYSAEKQREGIEKVWYTLVTDRKEEFNNALGQLSELEAQSNK